MLIYQRTIIKNKSISNLLERLSRYLIFRRSSQQRCLVFPNEILRKLVTVKQVIFTQFKFLFETERCMAFFENFFYGDRVASRKKKNLHYYYPLHLQDWAAWSILWRSLWLPLFCSGISKPSIPQAQTKLFQSIKMSTSVFKHLCFQVFHHCWCCWLMF